MLLDVAVEEGEAGLVGGEVYGGATVVGDHDGVFDEAEVLTPFISVSHFGLGETRWGGNGANGVISGRLQI